METKKGRKNSAAVSPINGQPVPRGRQFTSETAREARQKRTIKERNQKSITEEVKKRISSEILSADGSSDSGAALVADAIIKESLKGNPRMIELLLKMVGENPDTVLTVKTEREDDPLSAAFKAFGKLDGD